jgi:hypothetical protein
MVVMPFGINGSHGNAIVSPALGFGRRLGGLRPMGSATQSSTKGRLNLSSMLACARQGGIALRAHDGRGEIPAGMKRKLGTQHVR